MKPTDAVGRDSDPRGLFLAQMAPRSHFLQIQFLLEHVQHGVVDRSVAMEPQDLGAACADGGQDDGEMLLLVGDQAARRLAETCRRPRAIAVLFDEARMTCLFTWPCRLSLDLRQLYRRHAGARVGLGQSHRLLNREAVEAQETDQRRQGCSLNQDGHQDDGEGCRQDKITTGEGVR